MCAPRGFEFAVHSTLIHSKLYKQRGALKVFFGQWWTCLLESFQDFLIKLDMKPCIHLVEISIFSLNNVTVRPIKIMNRADKYWPHFLKIKYFKKIQKHFLLKVGLLLQYSSKKKNWKDSINFPH